MESIYQLLGNRIGVAYINKVEGNHQRDEHTLQEVQFLYPRLCFLHLDNHADKGMNLPGNGKGYMR